MSRKKLRIEYNMDKCIGNVICAAIAPDYFVLHDKKAALLRSKREGNVFLFEKELSDEDAKLVIDAAIACPVNTIRIFDAAKNRI